MNDFLRIAAMTLLACVPWLTHAQSVKCTRPAASAGHRQSQCDQETVEADVSTGSSDGLFHFSKVRNDLTPACRASTDDAIGSCSEQIFSAKNRCFQAKLPTACQAQTGLSRANRDPVCEQQINKCEGESSRNFPACIQRELPPSCMEEVRAANRAREHRN